MYIHMYVHDIYTQDLFIILFKLLLTTRVQTLVAQINFLFRSNAGNGEICIKYIYIYTYVHTYIHIYWNRWVVKLTHSTRASFRFIPFITRSLYIYSTCMYNVYILNLYIYTHVFTPSFCDYSDR